jgi:hypothetical protein
MKSLTGKSPSVLELEAALRFLGPTATHAELVSFATHHGTGRADKSRPIR